MREFRIYFQNNNANFYDILVQNTCDHKQKKGKIKFSKFFSSFEKKSTLQKLKFVKNLFFLFFLNSKLKGQKAPESQCLVWTYLVRASNLVKFLVFFQSQSNSRVSNVCACVCAFIIPFQLSNLSIKIKCQNQASKSSVKIKQQNQASESSVKIKNQNQES